MSGIRVTYSGLISFIVGIATVVTGLVFTLIVTRELTQDEYGTWGLIGGLLTHVLFFGPIISYWATREIARGNKSGKTALISNSLFSVVGIIVFLLVAYLYGSQTEVNQDILFFATILVPVELTRIVLVGISLAHKPQSIEYGLIAFEATKIPLAILFIFVFEMSLIGVILSVFFATIANIIVLLINSRNKIKGKFEKSYLKKWLKLFWLPSWPNISAILTNTDVIIFSILTGSVGGLAYWGTARAVAIVVNHSQKINKAVYPKLLSGGQKNVLQENLTRVLYFALPLSAMAIVFSKPALFALNPIYAIGFPVVIALVPVIFLRTIENIFVHALSGIEKVDTDEKATFKDYLRSKLFYLPTLRIIHRGGYLLALTIMLILLIPFNFTDVDLVVYWALVALLTQIPYTVYLFILVKREFILKINLRIFFKYFISSAGIFGLVYLIMEQYLQYSISIFDFLPQLLLFVGIGVIGYVAVTYVIDSHTRKITKAVINEIKMMVKKQ